ncbi:MAG: putative serine protease HhoB precursor [Firmicutes bacterium ADurb.Bin193]|nr:MAG: putative serine protease HhoB precursor [Firmicutes bacterium ADurb.Bin193]
MKKLVGAVTALAIICSAGLADIDFTPSVYVNGNKIEADIIMKDDRIYVPLRAVSESMGATVSWDETNNTASIETSRSDSILPQVIKDASPFVVAIIGGYSFEGTPAYKEKYMQGTAHGTGVIIKSGGEILTNAHVVKDLNNIIVVLYDGSGYEATIKYIDEETDLAVIKINRLGLQTARFADDEDIVIGKTVVAIGTPISFSLRNSASLGIISGINRSITNDYRLIQTDASINPGNSGGPLVNMNGEVVGINSSKLAGIGVEGMGFSIPAGTVKYVLKHFETYGRVRRPDIGATLQESVFAYMGLPADTGLMVSSVKEGSPAQTAGILINDTIIEVNGCAVHSIVDWNEEMKKYLPADTVTLKVQRGTEQKDISIKFSEK